MAKKTKQAKQKYSQLAIIIAAAVFLSCAIIVWAILDARPDKPEPVPPLPNHTMPYVDGETAVAQVENFYKSYLKPNLTNKKGTNVEIFGSDNLAFYYAYYQHGFDPITCSTVTPVKVTASLVSTGPVAIVNVKANYPDNTSSDIQATVVLNNDGIDIDSISCPGDKGNLPPKSI